MLQNIYPKTKLDFVGVSTDAPFNGALLQILSDKYNILPNFMFMSCPSEHFPYDIAELGGVRLITH